MAGQILALFAHHFSQPFLDVGVADIIVVAPALVAGVVGRVDIDALHLALILRQQGFQCFKIIAVDDHVLTVVVLGVLPLLIKTVLAAPAPGRELPDDGSRLYFYRFIPRLAWRFSPI